MIINGVYVELSIYNNCNNYYIYIEDTDAEDIDDIAYKIGMHFKDKFNSYGFYTVGRYIYFK